MKTLREAKEEILSSYFEEETKSPFRKMEEILLRLGGGEGTKFPTLHEGQQRTVS